MVTKTAMMIIIGKALALCFFERFLPKKKGGLRTAQKANNKKQVTN